MPDSGAWQKAAKRCDKIRPPTSIDEIQNADGYVRVKISQDALDFREQMQEYISMHEACHEEAIVISKEIKQKSEDLK